MSGARLLFSKYPILRGVVSYAALWPTGSLIQQTIEGRRYPNYDYMRCLRFAFWGSCVIGPTMFLWMRLANRIFPQKTLKSSVKKALLEQIVYDPWAISAFLFVMTILEGKDKEEAKLEVKEKFLDTYKVGVVYWPIVQTINFGFVPARNQVIFVSFFSMVWSTFMAYMQHLELKRLEQQKVVEEEEAQKIKKKKKMKAVMAK